MSDIKFECSHCKQHLACDEQDVGKQIQCPACNQLIQIPEVAREAAPSAGPSRLRISHQNPKAPAEAAVSLPADEPLETEPEPAPGRVWPWRWIWRLTAYAVLAVVLVLVWPKLTKLRELPKEASNVSKLSVQALTVQFAMLDSEPAKPGETSEAMAKFVAAMKENFGHANLTSFSETQKSTQWVEQWSVGTSFKVFYNRDKTEIVLWGRVNDRNAIIRTFIEVKEADFPNILKQTKEGIQVLSKSS